MSQRDVSEVKLKLDGLINNFSIFQFSVTKPERRQQC